MLQGFIRRLFPKRILAFLLTLSLCAGLTGCRRDAAPSSSSQTSSVPQEPMAAEYPAEVFGREILSQPVRVVSLSPAITELLCAFGYGDRLFGVSAACDYPEMVYGLPRCGTSLLPDLEQIEEISPDYLLTETPLQLEDFWAIQDLDVEIVEIAAPQDFAQVMELYRNICVLMDGAFSGANTGETLADLYTQQFSVLQEKVSEDPLGNTLSAVFIIDSSGIAATGGTFYHEILSALGLINLEEGGTGFSGSSSGGQPDLILYGDRMTKEDIQQSPAFGEWEAVKEDRMVQVPLPVLERASPRMFDMLEQLAKQIYTAPWIGS